MKDSPADQGKEGTKSYSFSVDGTGYGILTYQADSDSNILMAMGVFSNKAGDFLMESCGKNCLVLYLWDQRKFYLFFGSLRPNRTRSKNTVNNNKVKLVKE